MLEVKGGGTKKKKKGNKNHTQETQPVAWSKPAFSCNDSWIVPCGFNRIAPHQADKTKTEKRTFGFGFPRIYMGLIIYKIWRQCFRCNWLTWTCAADKKVSIYEVESQYFPQALLQRIKLSFTHIKLLSFLDRWHTFIRGTALGAVQNKLLPKKEKKNPTVLWWEREIHSKSQPQLFLPSKSNLLHNKKINQKNSFVDVTGSWSNGKPQKFSIMQWLGRKDKCAEKKHKDRELLI